MLARAFALVLATALVASGGAGAANFASLSAQARSPEGLSWERARSGMSGLKRPTFDHADLNGDGVIDAREWPTMQSL